MENDIKDYAEVQTEAGYTMTVRDVATMFNLSEATIRNMALSQTVPSVKIGRQFRFNTKQLLSHLKDGYRNGE